MAAGCVWMVPAAEAREVRVASYNIENGTGDIDSLKYLAIQTTLARMDADIVCFQELRAATFAAWSNLASELGYPYAAISGSGPFSGYLYNGYFSRFPIQSTYNVPSPPGAVELTRFPFRAVIDVPDAQHPLVLWTMHHKSSAASIDKFRRAIEAYRIVQDVDAYLAANPDHVEYVLTGDMNDDIRDGQTPVQFASQPSGAPGAFVLGADITFPMPYATFPVDRYADAGAGFLHASAFWEGTATPITRPSSSRQLDYVFLSPALVNSPLGAPQAEVYYSDWDAGGGLPKLGDPLPGGTSAAASDHLPIFLDIQMADYCSVLPVAGFDAVGEAGGPFDPEYKTYTFTETNSFATSWVVETDVSWLSVEVESFELAPYAPLEVDVFLNENAAALLPGVYVGTIDFWNETIAWMETRTVTLTVRDSLTVWPEYGLVASGIVGGPFNPTARTYVVTNKSELAMTFTATAAENWLAISPSYWLLQPGQSVAMTTEINANASSLPIGNYVDSVIFSNQVTGLVHERPVTLAIAGALCDAVDRCDLVWTSGGDADWFHQADIAFDGEDAAQSGAITSSQQTWMETTVTGPVNVQFQWKTSTRSSHYLRFHVDGSAITSISGETGWTNRTQELTAGTHTLRWGFTNTTLAPQGSNAVWVDQVVLDYLAVTPATLWNTVGTPGGPFSPATRDYILTNSGPEAVAWTAIPDVDWMSAVPPAGNLESGASTTVLLVLNENAPALPSGSYLGTIAFSNQTTGTASLRQARLTIRDYLIITPSYLWFDGFVSGPYTPPSQSMTISNSGPAAIAWAATQSANWASLIPAGGNLDPGESRAVEVAINSNANALAAGWTYLDLAFSNATTQILQYGDIYLYLVEPLQVIGDGGAPTGPVGGPFVPDSMVFTLTNQSPVSQTWMASANVNWLTLDRLDGSLAGNTATAITATVNDNANGLPKGAYSASVVFSNPATGATIAQQITLSVGVIFCEAIEACELEWTLGGNAPWLYQTNTTWDGMDAAASGSITDSQESWMQTQVVGPGTLSFWWKVSSESGYDYLEFWINGVLTNRISGEVDWQQPTYALGSGPHVLRWRYAKEISYASGSDRGWVDLVSWTPSHTAMGVPIAWYQRFGLAPAEGGTWDDLDPLPAAAGDPNWFQYVAGLTPTNSTDAFRILNIQQAAGEPTRLEWWGGTNGPAAPYVIQSSPVLKPSAWESIGTSPRTAGLNVWTNATPIDDLHFYRILAEPDPSP